MADCEKIKADLDKLDLNCAQLYAARSKRKTEDLLALMRVGGWLTAKEALDWGFINEITDLADEAAPKLTDALASAMANAGIPIPNIPVAETGKEGAFARFIANTDGTDGEFVTEVCQRHNIHRTTAYSDLAVVKSLLPMLGSA